MRPPRRRGRRLAVLTAATVAVTGAGVATAPLALAAADDPAAVGSWSAPFEEGGAGTPRCRYVPNDTPNDSRERLECKITAVTTAVLPDGRVLYGNGIESEENAEEAAVPSLSTEARSGRTRVLDLTDGTPSWTVPANERTDGDNPNIVAGRTSDRCPAEAPLGVAGVPGRGGDGLAGSVTEQLGGPSADPTCSPDDVANNDGDIFCGDIVQLSDGRQMLVGGTDWYNEPSILEKADGDPVNFGVIELEGLRSARIFDGSRNAWRATSPMKFGRWYPAATTMSDGTVMIVSGTLKLIKSTQGSQVRRTETYDPATRQWTENYVGLASEKTLPENPRVYLAPNGTLFYTGDGQMFGPFGQAVDEALFGVQSFFDPTTQTWQDAGLTVPRSSPTSVALPMKAPYDSLTILRAGGTLGPTPGSYVAVPTTDLTTIHADGTVTSEAGPMLSNPRWFTQPTPLPDGNVLLTSGARNDEVMDPGFELPVKQPELYNPETRTFTPMATPERARTYHNNAVLLPNGQVLVGGNSPISAGYGMQRDVVPGVTGNNDKDPSFELFTPPYLHRGARPGVDYAPSAVRWGERFTVDTDASVEKVLLMRMPSPQHVLDNDTRTLELPFENSGGSLTVTTPPSGKAAPPGFYYLFVSRADGAGGYVPSVASIVHVGDFSDDANAPQPMGPETVEGFDADGATPIETNTYFNNPPNPLEPPTVPGERDPLGVPDGIPGISAPVTGGGAARSSDDPAPEPAVGQPAVLPQLPPTGAGRRRRRAGPAR